MHGNYNWQKQQASENLQARQREAHMHRLSKQNQEKGESKTMKTLAAFLLFLFLYLVGSLLPR